MDYVKESALLLLLAQPRLRPEALKPCNLCIQFARRLKVSKNRDIGREILQGLRELKRGETGRVVNLPPVSEIRRKVGLSQSRFAALLGVPVRTLQDWEQGRRAPSGAARTLLLIAEKNPGALLDVA
jgi:putative transcriptional regulator